MFLKNIKPNSALPDILNNLEAKTILNKHIT